MTCLVQSSVSALDTWKALGWCLYHENYLQQNGRAILLVNLTRPTTPITRKLQPRNTQLNVSLKFLWYQLKTWRKVARVISKSSTVMVCKPVLRVSLLFFQSEDGYTGEALVRLTPHSLEVCFQAKEQDVLILSSLTNYWTVKELLNSNSLTVCICGICPHLLFFARIPPGHKCLCKGLCTFLFIV